MQVGFAAREEPEAFGAGGGLEPELDGREERVEAHGGLGELRADPMIEHMGQQRG